MIAVCYTRRPHNMSPLLAGDVADYPADVAASLVASGVAVYVEPPAPVAEKAQDVAAHHKMVTSSSGQRKDKRWR